MTRPGQAIAGPTPSRPAFAATVGTVGAELLEAALTVTFPPAKTRAAGDAGGVEPPDNPALPFRSAEPIRSYNLRHL